MELERRMKRIKIDIEAYKGVVSSLMKMMMERKGYENVDVILLRFKNEFEEKLKKYEKEDVTEFLKFQRIVRLSKPVMATVLEPGEDFDMLCDWLVSSFNAVLSRVKGQLEQRGGPQMINGLSIGREEEVDIEYYCTICEQFFEISKEEKKIILNTPEKATLQEHHGQQMEIRIRHKRTIVSETEEEEIKLNEADFSAEFLMGHINTKDASADYLEILSVGIDIGSSTSHLVFSKLTLKRERSFFNMTYRFFPVSRKVIYEGAIINTPLIDRFTIDVEAIVSFCKEEYLKAGITPEMVDTGAVIVTGETAKKQNAEEIVKRLSSEAGKFVSATAGPNFESLLGIMGSGMVNRSLVGRLTILNVDVGGGTSNLAIVSEGQIVSTSCINVGGRLLGIDKNFKIWRIDVPTEFLMKEMGMNYKLGDIILEGDAKIIAREYAKALLEVMKGKARSEVAKELMMTDDLDFSIPIDEISFSGGVAEMIYGEEQDYEDIGLYLAKELKRLAKEEKFEVVEPENKIRATVIGAGSFSLSVSGSTCYFDKNISFPIENVPVLIVNVDKDKLSEEHVQIEVKKAFKRFDLEEGKDLVALYFEDPVYRRDMFLSIFAKGIEKALPNSIALQNLIILFFRSDMGSTTGITIRNETAIQKNLICLDELDLETGDWVDIGAAIRSSQVFPLTVKSLVFSNSSGSEKT
ncbi:MAG: ethanolamine ammonia-lyase reactivating factor EutA [Candidatus Kariarchaeaceae archaeon]